MYHASEQGCLFNLNDFTNFGIVQMFSFDCGNGKKPSRSETLVSVAEYNSAIGFHPLYTGRLFHCYMLDESIYLLVVSGPLCRYYSIFDGKSCYQAM